MAGTREAVRAIRRVVAKDAEIVAAYSTGEALKRLEGRIDLIVCNVRFDESRMFDFLQVVKSQSPAIPVVCCRVSTAELSAPMHRAIEMALDVLGIETFVDCAPLYREQGEAGAVEGLRRAILSVT